MLFSFVVAMTIAPWLMLKLAPRSGNGSGDASWRGPARTPVSPHRNAGAGEPGAGLDLPARRRRGDAGGLRAVLYEDVTVKLLPFDNKSELQVVLNLPAGASLEETEQTLFAAVNIAFALPEVRTVQAQSGTAAPFNFNGLVRHSYLRGRPEQGDLQVNLAPLSERARASHAIALELRARLRALALPEGATLQVVEVPPGPPVLATLLAEIYGPDGATRRAVADEIKTLFLSVPYIVDVDDSHGRPRPRLRIAIDQDALEHFGVEQSDVYDTVQALFGHMRVGTSHRGEERDPIDIVIGLPKSDLAWSERLASTPVPANTLPGNRTVVELGEVVHARQRPARRCCSGAMAALPRWSRRNSPAASRRRSTACWRWTG